MKIVFFGTPAVAVPPLRGLIEAGHEIPLVVTQPDRPTGRSRKPVAPAVKDFALGAGLVVEQPAKLRTRGFRERIGACAPDLLVVVAFGRILSTRLIEQTPMRAVNLHFSLLPRYRGAAPVQWALANGDRSTGVTTMFINERLDEGDTLLVEKVPIQPREHAPALFERLAHIGARVLIDTVERLAAGTIRPMPQAHDDATLAPILKREDGWVDPAALEARLIEGRIRGFDPWPGVWLRYRGRRLRLVRAETPEAPPLAGFGAALEEPGRLIGPAPALVCARRSVLRLLEVQPEGRRVMSVADALNGRQLVLGERFEPIGTP